MIRFLTVSRRVLVVTWLGSSAAWGVVKATLEAGPDPIPALVATAALVALWLTGLALLALVCAWRTAVWTVAADALYAIGPVVCAGPDRGVKVSVNVPPSASTATSWTSACVDSRKLRAVKMMSGCPPPVTSPIRTAFG